MLLYHSDLLWMPGGFLGVDVFFVLSGFLITSLLLGELSRAGRIDFRGFSLRRTRRLLPALLVLLAFSSLLAATVTRDAAGQYLADLPPAVLDVPNWSYVFSDQSYFAEMGPPPAAARASFVLVNEHFAWLYRGGFLAIAALAAVPLAVASHPASLLGRGLGVPPLRWLGERSGRRAGLRHDGRGSRTVALILTRAVRLVEWVGQLTPRWCPCAGAARARRARPAPAARGRVRGLPP